MPATTPLSCSREMVTTCRVSGDGIRVPYTRGPRRGPAMLSRLRGRLRPSAAPECVPFGGWLWFRTYVCVWHLDAWLYVSYTNCVVQ